MQIYDLLLYNDEVLIIINKNIYVMDIGFDNSFSHNNKLTIDGIDFNVASRINECDSEELSNTLNLNISGLIGADIINSFDFLYDIANSKVTISKDEINFEGNEIDISFCGNYPKFEISILDKSIQVSFGIGISISYLDNELIDYFREKKILRNFYDKDGDIAINAYQIRTKIGEMNYDIKYTSPNILFKIFFYTFNLFGCLGNDFIGDKKVGYFPRRKKIIIENKDDNIIEPFFKLSDLKIKYTPREIIFKRFANLAAEELGVPYNSKYGYIMPIKGGWGYTKEDAVIIDKNDPVVDPNIPFVGIRLEYIFAKYRTCLELITYRKENERFSKIELNLIKQSLIKDESGIYDKLTFEITALHDKDFFELKSEWENNFYLDSFDKAAHFEKRKAKQIHLKRDFWFEISSFYGQLEF
jgi:hypothetical protein